MADTGLIVGLAGVLSGAAVAAASGYWQWQIARLHEAAESDRTRKEHAVRRLEHRQQAYSDLIAFLARPGDAVTALPVISLEEREAVLGTFAKVVLLGTPAVREQAESIVGGLFGLAAGSIPTSRDELNKRIAALIQAMREDVIEGDSEKFRAGGFEAEFTRPYP